ncbi:MAG: tyrosine-type recombinase/integrase, partial [Bacteroides sp.]
MWPIDEFLNYLKYERNYSGRTVEAYGDDLRQFETFGNDMWKELKPEQVDADLVREWIVSLMEQKYTTTSVNRKLSSLRAYFKYMLKQGQIERDPMRKIVGPKNKKPLPVFVKEEEMDRLLDGDFFGDDFEGCRGKCIVETFYSTGMRRSELIGLNDTDVDFQTFTIKVTGKRNKQRIIPFDKALKEELQNYLTRRNNEIPVRSGAFFVKQTGERITAGMVERIVKKSLSKVVTIKKRSPHVLRHSFATAMLNHQAELGAIKELLGHESLATTEIYTH